MKLSLCTLLLNDGGMLNTIQQEECQSTRYFFLQNWGNYSCKSSILRVLLEIRYYKAQKNILIANLSHHYTHIKFHFTIVLHAIVLDVWFPKKPCTKVSWSSTWTISEMLFNTGSSTEYTNILLHSDYIEINNITGIFKINLINLAIPAFGNKNAFSK